ncbi:MAG: hypothetical protein IJK84_09625 [Bacteroidales bacterium]|nr:hypothetical protein [Bacteroidales bacterium]
MTGRVRRIVWVAVPALLLLVVAGAAYWRAFNSTNPWHATQVGDIPAPRGFSRVEVPVDSYAAYLRALPLKGAGAKLHLYSGQEAKHQFMAAAIVDQPLLSKYEQCADVAIRLWAEYLWQQGRYEEICFTDVCDSVLCYHADTVSPDSLRQHFEDYLLEVYKWCNTASVYRETMPRLFSDVEGGDLLVHPAEEGEEYGHAIVVADVARDAKGRVAILCLEGNTPAREKHIVRNKWPWRNPWFIIGKGDREIRFIKSRFRQEHLRHY